MAGVEMEMTTMVTISKLRTCIRALGRNVVIEKTRKNGRGGAFPRRTNLLSRCESLRLEEWTEGVMREAPLSPRGVKAHGSHACWCDD